MTLASEDTIFALATGAARSAVAVMRVSGPASGAILESLCGKRPEPRRATLRRLRNRAGEPLDLALVLWMPGPGSYTGQDSAEFSLHGGRAVVEGVADALVEAGARPAEPGEFTKRAFLNGRMDLLEAEAVSDLIGAETAAQRAQALRQLDGVLGDLYRGWTDRIRMVLAQQEALIDFPDQEIPEETEAAMLAEVGAVTAELEAHLGDARRGERLREGLVFSITGPPNVGKSSLLNALAERDVAIVAPTPGTTRDALETRVVLGGVPVTLVDTAGLRDTEDQIEAQGVRRARAWAEAADLVLAVSDRIGAAERLNGFSGEQIRIRNKIDLGGIAPAGSIPISVLTGEGMDGLRNRLAAEARRLTEGSGPPPLTRARHRAALRDAAGFLRATKEESLAELRAENLRLALRGLGSITGMVGVEDLLDTIFSQFCIGK
ncbi:MAG: tRNA uridine-5-carboxymethylaminomethyl(34) synthesis GTPase MnmE [Acetobacteraceae bacterium]|nr:tRNA uridine-5-carboxymethylaminomethyl(34) synthesis GTPase MnmE [Acetobacteraceae bacterium]